LRKKRLRKSEKGRKTKMTEGNWDAREASAEFVDVPLGGVWTAPDGARYRCVGGGCGRCAFLRPPVRVRRDGVETTCANQLDADLNGCDRLACFSFERRDGVGVRFERIDEPEPTGSDAPKLGESGSDRRERRNRVRAEARIKPPSAGVAAWLRERWKDDPGGVVLAVAALVWGALVVAALFG
jgi:hypothetical protein